MALEAQVLDARRSAAAGISLLRLGDFASSEQHLEAAMYLGDQEATVEYGNWLRCVGRFEDASVHLTEILPNLSDELAYRATRWIGVICFQSGKIKESLKYLEIARRGYRLIDDSLNEAKVVQNLAAVYNDIGEQKKAELLLGGAIITFRALSYRNLLIQSLHNLIGLKVTTGKVSDIEQTIEELESLIAGESSHHNIRV